jgi:hypothetical protein
VAAPAGREEEREASRLIRWKLADRLAASAALSAVALIFLWPATVGDKVLSQADMLYMYPPWTACRPPDLSLPSNAW